MKAEINVADLFCGAGGSSTGLAQACEELGVEFALTAVNGTVTSKNGVGVVEPFLTAHFGERPTQEPRTHAIDDPLPTVTHRGAGDLVQPVVGAQQGRVVEIDGRRYVLDVRFRMLQPHELAAAQGFPADYKFTGTKSDQTAQIGNAVPVGVARALVREALIALGFGREAAA